MAFFGKLFEEKSGRMKRKQKYAYPLPRTIFRRDARAIFYQEMNDEELLRQPQGKDNGRRGKIKMQYGTSDFAFKSCGVWKPRAMALMLHCYVLAI